MQEIDEPCIPCMCMVFCIYSFRKFADHPLSLKFEDLKSTLSFQTHLNKSFCAQYLSTNMVYICFQKLDSGSHSSGMSRSDLNHMDSFLCSFFDVLWPYINKIDRDRIELVKP